MAVEGDPVHAEPARVLLEARLYDAIQSVGDLLGVSADTEVDGEGWPCSESAGSNGRLPPIKASKSGWVRREMCMVGRRNGCSSLEAAR